MEILADAIQYEVLDVQDEFTLSTQIGRKVVERALHDVDSSDIVGVGAFLVEDRKLIDRFYMKTDVE